MARGTPSRMTRGYNTIPEISFQAPSNVDEGAVMIGIRHIGRGCGNRLATHQSSGSSRKRRLGFPARAVSVCDDI
jgi:hypothetical protein